MVKRLRHHPFTVVSRVRIPVGSPKTSPSGSGRTLHGVVERSEKPLRLLEEARNTAGQSPRTYKMFCFWKYSSVGRASALQAGGHRFEPYTAHQ